MNDANSAESERPPIETLSKLQRRLLGVLIEKGITTPEYYPMTPKALAAGCNQKNNRAPLTEYSEDDVIRGTDELRELGLAAVVHTESGRTERFRHYARKRFPFNEPQLAIMTELWLRGRQSLGDLRTRASRMQAIDSLDLLRNELQNLLAAGYVQANGPLESRGVEVDHNFYLPEEKKSLTTAGVTPALVEDDDSQQSGVFKKADAVPITNHSVNSVIPVHEFDKRVNALEQIVERLHGENTDLRERLRSLEGSLSQLNESNQTLRRELGCS